MRQHRINYKLPILNIISNSEFQMNLDTLFDLKDDDVVSHEKAQLLNECLARISCQDILPQHREKISDYLVMALNMDSVQLNLRPALDLLLSSLQERQ